MTRIQMRRGTAASWTAANPILASGENGFETDTGREKIGDGAKAWVSLPYKSQVFSVENYGAVGDGVANDTAAIEAASVAAAAVKGTLVFGKSKTYLVDSIKARTSVTYDGQGCIVKARISTQVGIFVSSGWFDTVTTYDTIIRNFHLDMNAIGQSGVFLSKAERCLVEDNVIYGFNKTYANGAIRFYYDTVSCTARRNHITHDTYTVGAPETASGIFCVSSPPDQYGGGNNATISFSTPATTLSRGHVIEGNTILNGTHGITLYAAQDCRVIGNYTSGQTHRGIILSPITNGNLVANNTIRDFHSTGIHLAWGACDNVISGNSLLTTVSDQEGDGIKGYFGCSGNTVTGNRVQGTLLYGIRFGEGCVDNNITGNIVKNVPTGIAVFGFHPVASGYLNIATPPDAGKTSIVGNSTHGCATGLLLTAFENGNVAQVVVNQNSFWDCSTSGVTVSEANSKTVTGVAAHGNRITKTAGAFWTLARGERHFDRKTSNTAMIDSPQVGFYRSGQYYGAPPTASTTTLALVDATMRIAPFPVMHSTTFTEASFETTVAGASGSVCRVVIYASDENGVPKVLVFDSGTVATDPAAGVKTVTMGSLALTAGNYWIGLAPQGGVAAPTVRSINNLSGHPEIMAPATWNGAAPAVANGQPLGYTVSSVTGSPPNPPTLAFTSNDAAKIYVKVA